MAMNDEQAALWKRISEYAFDAEGAAHTFSARLAKENRWTRAYALRAIEEYRRFVFLGVCAGPVTPSEAVDEVWHLHLLYTREYWETFCDAVLRRPFHHQPSQGGAEEDAKFGGQYRRTLENYERFFGSAAPPDIWPRGKTTRPKKPSAGLRWLLGGSVLTVALAVLVGCATVAPTGSPFDYVGPDFLAFYGMLYVLCLGLAIAARYYLRLPGDGPKPTRIPMNADAAAYMAGGQQLVTNAAFASLVARNALALDPLTRALKVAGPLPTDATPMQQDAYAWVEAGGGSRSLLFGSSLDSAVMRIDADLKGAGLLVSEANVPVACAVPILVAMVAPVVGIAKIAVGLSRGRPVEFLIVLCVVSIVIAFAAFARRPFRSRYGDKVLAELRSSHDFLKQGPPGTADAGDDMLMLSIALFGMGALLGAPFGYIVPVFQPPPGSPAMGSCSGSGGCSGGSCGGGSGCGGCSTS